MLLHPVCVVRVVVVEGVEGVGEVGVVVCACVPVFPTSFCPSTLGPF